MRKKIHVLMVAILLGGILTPAYSQESFFEDPNAPPPVAEPEEPEQPETPPEPEGPDEPFFPEETDPSLTEVSVTYPPYRIRYLADLIDVDQGSSRLIEEGVFNTVSQANEVINILAHLHIAGQVNCACEEHRRDAVGAAMLESQMMELMREAGYVSRLVPAREVATLPPYVRVLTPYLILNGDGYMQWNQPWLDPDRPNAWLDPEPGSWWSGWGGYTTTPVLNPSDPRQYARVDYAGIFVDTRLTSLVNTRVNQIMGGYRIQDPVSLCAFAALDRPLEDMMSWVLIRDLRRDWGADQPSP